MPNETFPMEFPKCRQCGCESTAAQIAKEKLDSEGRLSPELLKRFPHMRYVVAPLIPIKLAKLVQPVCVVYYDNCAECGHERCTRIERQDPQIQMMKVNPDGSLSEPGS